MAPEYDLIPLRNAKGRIVNYVVVDAADAAWLKQWTWSIDWGSKGRSKAYAVRFAKEGEAEYKQGRRVKLRMHRVLLGLPPGDPRVGHHKDDNGLHNWRGNLEILPDNHHNMRKSPGWRRPAREEDVGF